MATKGDRNMWEVYKYYNVINLYIHVCTCWFYSHSEARVRGHGIFKNIYCHFDITRSREILFLGHHVSSSRPSNPPSKIIPAVE